MRIDLTNGAIYHGDSLEVLKSFPDNSIDSVVTDPPYGLAFMGKKWDYDVPSIELWKEVLRVLKPGGHALIACGTRTQHRMAVNIEDAGFEIRDVISWVYGCLSEDTEILTINGWERFHKDIIYYPVLCYIVGENKFELQKPTKSFIYENEYPAYHIKSDYTDQLVSRNHRVLVERGGEFTFQWAETLEQQENIPFLESLHDLPETIYNSESHSGIKKQDLLTKVQEYDFSKETEKRHNPFNQNNLSDLRERVPNKKKPPIEILFLSLCRKGKRLVKELFSEWKGQKESGKRVERRKEPRLERRSNLLQNSWQLCWGKICEMSNGIFGDGTQRRLCYGTQAYNGSEFGETLNENGSGSPHRPRPSEQLFAEPYSICDKQGTQTIRRTRAKVSEVEYNGKVWCVEVPAGAFVARRNGKIFITGNSGFPKSLNIGNAIDKIQGNERKEILNINVDGRNRGAEPSKGRRINGSVPVSGGIIRNEFTSRGTSPYEGWGTALKPAVEFFTLVRKPISEKNIAENVLKWGTGGINIDGSRVKTEAPSNGDLFCKHLFSLDSFSHTPFSSVKQVLDYYQSISFALSSYSSLHKDPLHSVRLLDYSLNIQFQGVFYDLNALLNYGVEYANQVLVIQDSRFCYPTLSRFYDELPRKGAIHDLDILALFADARKYISDYQDSNENIHENHNILRLFSFLAIPLLCFLVIDKNNLYKYTQYLSNPQVDKLPSLGRFPANFIHSGDEEVTALFPETKGSATPRKNKGINNTCYGDYGTIVTQNESWGDQGSAARFFYCAKASPSERNEGLWQIEKKDNQGTYKFRTDGSLDGNSTTARSNVHPTVKPLALMQYLIRLITPPDGVVLDCFAGSGTTGVAAVKEHKKYILIEREEEYIKIIEARVKHAENKIEPTLFDEVV